MPNVLKTKDIHEFIFTLSTLMLFAMMILLVLSSILYVVEPLILQFETCSAIVSDAYLRLCAPEAYAQLVGLSIPIVAGCLIGWFLLRPLFHKHDIQLKTRPYFVAILFAFTVFATSFFLMNSAVSLSDADLEYCSTIIDISDPVTLETCLHGGIIPKYISLFIIPSLSGVSTFVVTLYRYPGLDK